MDRTQGVERRCDRCVDCILRHVRLFPGGFVVRRGEARRRLFMRRRVERRSVVFMGRSGKAVSALA